MITRRPKQVERAKAEQIAQASTFDHGDGTYQKRVNQIERNMVSLSLVVRPADKKKSGKETKEAIKKAKAKKTKQTKRPSEKDEKPKRKAKVVAKPKSPAAVKSKTGGSGINKAKPKKSSRGGGSGGAGKTLKSSVKTENIGSRWNGLNASSKAAWIRSHAGKDAKTGAADKAMTQIWRHLSIKSQKAHLERHPGSRLKVRKTEPVVSKEGKTLPKKAAPKKDAAAEQEGPLTPKEVDEQTDVTDPENAGPMDASSVKWWNTKGPKFQQNYLNKHPKSKFAIRHRTIVRNMMASADPKIRAAAKEMGGDFHTGMEGLADLRHQANGTEDDDAEKTKKLAEEKKAALRKTYIKIGSVVVLSLIAIAIFTPLGGAAMEFGEAWFNAMKERGFDDASNKAEASASANVSLSGINLEGHPDEDVSTKKSRAKDQEQLKWMTDSMTEFLLRHKDVAGFAKSITKGDKPEQAS